MNSGTIAQRSESFRVGAVLFSNQHGPLGATDTAAQLLNEWKEH